MKTKKVDKRTKEWKEAQQKYKDELEESRMIIAIKEHVPKAVLEQLYTMIGCTCTLDAITHFMEVPFPVTREMQIALNDYHYTLFNEKVRKTSCSTCLAKRIGRIRTKVVELIDW